MKANDFWAAEPTQHISYVSCHDDHCLRDRLVNTLGNDTSEETVLKLDKLAQTAVLTSQGVPFIFCGEELFRTKQGVGNSYKSPDAIRRAHPAFYLGTAEKVREHLEFLSVEGDNLVAFQLKDIQGIDPAQRIIVVLNSNKTNRKIQIPDDTYQIVVKDGKADRNGLGTHAGPNLEVEAQSAVILIKNQ